MRNKQQQQNLRQFLTVKEIIMAVMVAGSFGFLALEHLEKLSPEQLMLGEAYEIGVGLIFLAEFIFELYHAKDRSLYWRRHWFYLIASVPIPSQTFTLLRGIRLLRLLRLFKIFAHLSYENNTRLFEKTY